MNECRGFSVVACCASLRELSPPSNLSRSQGEETMAEYSAQVRWRRDESEDFTGNRYSRGHEWRFDGGAVVPASASPHIVPLPYSVETGVDPEEAFVAALSSCHMLFFLSLAGREGLTVDEYVDEAVGTMGPDELGRQYLERVVLRPRVRFASGIEPARAVLERLHHGAHERCFIANSVRTEVVTRIRDS